MACNSEDKNTVVIWTNQREFIPYAEVFNTEQNKIKLLVVYKQNPANSLPALKDEVPPDIVAGNLLRSEKKAKNFRSLKYLFTMGELDEFAFYPSLLASGRRKDAVYQIPVSFNIPAVVYSAENEKLITEDYMLSPHQIQTIASEYNQKTRDLYSRMGFAPQWYPEFMYVLACLNGSDFTEHENSFSWDKDALDRTVYSVRQWTEQCNGFPSDERDFSFKYLYTPSYKQILSGRCLFAFMTSDEIFSLSAEQLESVDFRWIQQDDKIPVKDSMVTMGLYKKARHKGNAEQFIKWFFTEEAQKMMIEHVRSMNLNTTTFGICGGFSSLKSVNEHIFPTYYVSLLSNLPASDYLQPPKILPLRWESLKERVVLPYLADSASAENLRSVKTIEERISDWSKQYF